MAIYECQIKWLGGLGFEAQTRQHQFVMDTKVENGGKDQGPSPKEVLLASICACSGMDVTSILQKMRLKLTTCDVRATTETTEGYPAIFKQVQMEYQIKGEGIKPEQVLKAVRLSMTKYCGVSAMVAAASPLLYQVFLNGELIGEDRADFKGTDL